MVKSKPKTLEEILKNVTPEQKEITQKLRSLINNAVPDAMETVRRGKITFVTSGKDFARISVYTDHVDLQLIGGTKLSSSLLKGTGSGKDLRHIKITSVKNIDETEFTRLLRDAAAIAELRP